MDLTFYPAKHQPEPEQEPEAEPESESAAEPEPEPEPGYIRPSMVCQDTNLFIK